MLGWYPIERQIEQVRLDPRKGEFLTATEKENGLAQLIFNRLPIPVPQLIGYVL
jgi:hypothetical protein